MPIRQRSGDNIKLAPGISNPAGFEYLFKLHEALKKYRDFGLIKMTYQPYEDLQMGGHRRLSTIALGRGSIFIPHILKCALDEILDHIDFTYLDTPVTVRHWTGDRWANFNAILEYLPKEDRPNNPYEDLDVLFTYRDMLELS